MPKVWTRAACFQHFGAECKNPRWSWPAKSPDGTIVVMTMWQDEIRREGSVFVYQSHPRSRERKRPGASERVENLLWARNHCEGLVRVVIMIAKDPKADPRSIEECFPQDRLIMRIVEIDETTGAFRGESVPPPPVSA